MRLPAEHPNVPDIGHFWRKNSSMNLALAFAQTHPGEGQDQDPVLDGCNCVTCSIMMSYRKGRDTKYTAITQSTSGGK